MKCASCGNELIGDVKFCTSCGAPVPPAPPSEVVAVKPPVQPTPLSPASKPLSPWAYFGLKLLFSLPLVGFICLIVFSLDDGNINRRNFARSYWCELLVGVIIAIILIVLILVLGVRADVLSELESVLL